MLSRLNSSKLLIGTALSLVLALPLKAETSGRPLWVRNTAISPDGKTVAFTYKGDIYTVSVDGGEARQITTNSRYDTAPVWSPDGKKIAFASDREGTYDIYVVNSNGGQPVRLTTGGGRELPLAFLNDSILLLQGNKVPFKELSVPPFLPAAYTVNINRPGTREVPYLSIPVQAASVSRDGKILYQDRKGFENLYRKHERSSGTADIWLINDGRYTKLTDFNGHDLNPVWAPGGQTFYYISEKDGTLNVYERSVDGSTEKQLTHFEKHPVRELSASNDGTLAFSWDGELYICKPGEDPRPVNMTISTDDYDSDIVKAIRKSGATNIAVSPNGKEVAFVLRGDIYVTSVKYKTTRRITDTDGQERSLDFAPDGRTLVYDSDRNGKWQLFTATIENPDEKQFAYATTVVEKPIYSGEASAQQPLFSPDGKWIAFLENRTELKVMDVKTKKAVTALPARYNYSYSDGDIPFAWSPNSKWLLVSYIGEGGWNNSDIALVSRDGNTVIDLTESGYSDGNPKWAMGGKAIVYESGKYGMKNQGSWGNQSDAFLMVLDGDAWDKFNLTEEEAALKEEADKNDKAKAADDKKDKNKKKKKSDKSKADKGKDDDKIDITEFDLANRRYRIKRLTTESTLLGDFYLSPKGDKFYYVAADNKGDANLYVNDLKKHETKILTKDVNGGFMPDSLGENIFVLSRNGITKIDLGSGDEKPVEFEALYDRKPSKEREYIYDHMLTQVKEKFYDEKLHGVDWKGYGEHYRKFLPYINNNIDFGILLSEILGELNASHTGGAGTDSAYPQLNTSVLGAVYDDSYAGKGLKVSEVIARGPLSTKAASVKPGEIILAIDGDTIAPGADYNRLLEGKTGRKTRLTVLGNDGKSRDVTVRPISQGAESWLLYHRWVEHNEHVTDSISGGRIGYVHVTGMDDSSFRTIYDRILGKYRNCDAIVVDTRYNGGGWLHNDIAILLSGKEYVRYSPRGQYIGCDPFSQWTKPSVMLINESNYSDAHATPYVYKTLGLGELIGAPVPGTMTAVWWETQIDPRIYFGIPQVTSLDRTGRPLENQQLDPDILIYNTPDKLLKGCDTQLETAVRHLMEKTAK